jgi:hypothetical protein
VLTTATVDASRKRPWYLSTIFSLITRLIVPPFDAIPSAFQLNAPCKQGG